MFQELTLLEDIKIGVYLCWFTLICILLVLLVKPSVVITKPEPPKSPLKTKDQEEYDEGNKWKPHPGYDGSQEP